MRPHWFLAIAILTCCGDVDDRIELSDGLANVKHHAIAFDGETYAVVWTTSPAVPTSAGDHLWFARVNPNRHFALEPTSVLDTGGTVDELHLIGARGRFTVWYRRIDASGNRLFALGLEPSGVELGIPQDLGALSTASPARTFSVTSTADGFAVVSPQGASTLIRLDSYNADLTLRGQKTLEASTLAQYEPAIAWSPSASQLIVMWREDLNVRVMRTDLAGTAAAASTTIADFGALQLLATPVAFDAGVVAGWTEGESRRRLRFAIGMQDAPWRTHAMLIPDNRHERIEWDVAVRNGNATLVWSSDAITALTVVRTGRLELTSGFALEGEIALSSERSPHFDPRIASGVDESGVTYRGFYDGAQRLYFTTVQ